MNLYVYLIFVIVLQEVQRNRMPWQVKLRKPIDTPLLNVHRKTFGLYGNILALKCYYILGNVDTSCIDQEILNLFLALMSLCCIRPYLPQNLTVVNLETLLFAFPSFYSECKCFPIFIILILCCYFHPAVELVLDLCLIICFCINILITIRGSTFYRLELFVMLYLLFILGIEELFYTLMLLTLWSIYHRSVHGSLNYAFIHIFMFIQVVSELFGAKCPINVQGIVLEDLDYIFLE